MWWVCVILVAALALPISASAASGVFPYQIFWKNPSAPDAILCAKMVFRPHTAEAPSAVPFCRAFRQFQVIEVRGAWARIGSDVWIENAVLTNPAILQRSDPRASRTPNLRAIKRAASRNGGAIPKDHFQMNVQQ
jgi:hypothetical protein